MNISAALLNPFREFFEDSQQNVPDDKTAMERRNMFCEAITEAESDVLNEMVQLRDTNEFEKLGRMICSRTVGYELNCAESRLDHDELFHYASIRATLNNPAVNIARTSVDQELQFYEANRLNHLPQYTYCRIKQVLELYFAFRATKEV